MATAESTKRIAQQILDEDKFIEELSKYDVERRMVIIILDLFREMNDKIADIAISRGGNIAEDLR
jgi:hypothetical protein